VTLTPKKPLIETRTQGSDDGVQRVTRYQLTNYLGSACVELGWSTRTPSERYLAILQRVYASSNTLAGVLRLDPKAGEVVTDLMPTQDFDSKKLTIDQNGLKEKLTSVYEAKIVEGILA
jgi:hypothetical protein